MKRKGGPITSRSGAEDPYFTAKHQKQQVDVYHDVSSVSNGRSTRSSQSMRHQNPLSPSKLQKTGHSSEENIMPQGHQETTPTSSTPNQYPSSFSTFADGIKSDIIDLVDTGAKTVSSIIFYPFANITNNSNLPTSTTPVVYDKALYGQAKRKYSNLKDDEEDDIVHIKNVTSEKVAAKAWPKMSDADMNMRGIGLGLRGDKEKENTTAVAPPKTNSTKPSSKPSVTPLGTTAWSHLSNKTNTKVEEKEKERER